MRLTLRFFGSLQDSLIGTLQALYAFPIVYLYYRYQACRRDPTSPNPLFGFTAALLVVSLIGMAYPEDLAGAIAYGAVVGWVITGVTALTGNLPNPTEYWLLGTTMVIIATAFSYWVSQRLTPRILARIQIPQQKTPLLNLVEKGFFIFYLVVLYALRRA